MLSVLVLQVSLNDRAVSCGLSRSAPLRLGERISGSLRQMRRRGRTTEGVRHCVFALFCFNGHVRIARDAAIQGR